VLALEDGFYFLTRSVLVS